MLAEKLLHRYYTYSTHECILAYIKMTTASSVCLYSMFKT